MGAVFLAERADGQFAQRVAVKIIHYGAPGLVRRFLEERRILALLRANRAVQKLKCLVRLARIRASMVSEHAPRSAS
jgi:hypothetical protein